MKLLHNDVPESLFEIHIISSFSTKTSDGKTSMKPDNKLRIFIAYFQLLNLYFGYITSQDYSVFSPSIHFLNFSLNRYSYIHTVGINLYLYRLSTAIDDELTSFHLYPQIDPKLSNLFQNCNCKYLENCRSLYFSLKKICCAIYH